MKTIQKAFATNSNLFRLPILLLAFLFNFSIGEPTPVSPIGGNSVPRHFAHSDVSKHDDIPIDPIGGNGGGSTMPRNLLNRAALTSITTDLPIGGNQGVPRNFIEIGGNQTAPRSFAEIGGGGNETRKILDMEIIGGIGGGQVPPRTLKPQLAIGLPIGETQKSPKSFLEIGGQSAPRHLTVAIGGQQTLPHPLSEIGGTQSPPRPYTEIGGGQLPPREIGGGQETRKIADIGGQQTAPRTFGIEIAGNSCPRC